MNNINSLETFAVVRKTIRVLTLPFLLLATLAPAYAGHWVVTMSGSASASGTTEYTFQNSQIVTRNPNASGPGIFFPNCANGASVQYASLYPGDVYSMTAQATFTWTPDAPHDNSLPPASVTVLETGNSELDILDTATGPVLMQANDEFLTTNNLSDPATFNNYGTGGPQRELKVQSSGAYVMVNVTLPPGALSFTLPQRMSSGGLGAPKGAGTPGGNLTYTASIDTTPDVTIQVSSLTTVPSGTVSVPITVTSVNGCSGTVALSITGLPSGFLPSMPSGQSVSGGWTNLDMPSGGSSVNGPTVAQLAAGVTGSISPASVTLTSGGTATATLTLSAASWAALSTYSIQVQGVSTSGNGSGTRDGLTTLTIN